MLPEPYEIDGDEEDELFRVTEEQTKEGFKADLLDLIPKMMFVSGETGEPSTETTTMIEGIVQQQVIEMVREPLRSSFFHRPPRHPKAAPTTSRLIS